MSYHANTRIMRNDLVALVAEHEAKIIGGRTINLATGEKYIAHLTNNQVENLRDEHEGFVYLSRKGWRHGHSFLVTSAQLDWLLRNRPLIFKTVEGTLDHGRLNIDTKQDYVEAFADSGAMVFPHIFLDEEYEELGVAS